MNRILSILLVALPLCGFAQKYVVEKSKVSFYSHAPIEDITAMNKKTSGIFDASTSEIVFSVPISEFQFEKSLMQEHFNEKYMESDKYPKGTFKGKISAFNAASEAAQESSATGDLTIHGVTKSMVINGSIEKVKGNYVFKAKFPVKLADHKIEIPQLLFQNIAEEVEVTVEFSFKPQ